MSRLQAQLHELQARNLHLRAVTRRSKLKQLDHPALAALGYCFLAGASGQPSDWVLRQIGNRDKGFEWKGQENYDAVGEAVTDLVKYQLAELCSLDKFSLPKDGLCYVSKGLQERQSPLLLLVCGSSPGGAAGVWGRSLCVNSTLQEGAMYDYIFRAEALGWSVVVADPRTDDASFETPHVHLQRVWKEFVAPSACSCVAVVAHSYGQFAVVSPKQRKH